MLPSKTKSTEKSSKQTITAKLVRTALVATAFVGLAACSSTGVNVMPAMANTNATDAQCNPYQDEVRHSILRLRTQDSTASGVVVAQDRVLTVAHAVDKSRKVVAEVEGFAMQAEVIAIDEANDLAILDVPTGAIPAVTIADEKLTANEQVWAVGFPLASNQRVSEGIYESLYNGRLYSNVHINSGTSGGGLLRCDDSGDVELAGIVHGYIAKSIGSDLVNIGDSVSVPVPTIRHFINSSLSGMVMDEQSRLTVRY